MKDAVEGSKAVFCFRQAMRRMIEDDIQDMVRSIQPIGDPTDDDKQLNDRDASGCPGNSNTIAFNTSATMYGLP